MITGLGLALGRSSSCPPTAASQNPVQTDPCAIGYKVKIPIWGEDIVEIPVNQMTTDAINQAVRTMPSYLPTVINQANAQLQPIIEKTLHDKVTPYINFVINSEVLPQIELQKDDIFAKAEKIKDETLTTVIITSIGLSMVSLLGIYYLSKRIKV